MYTLVTLKYNYNSKVHFCNKKLKNMTSGTFLSTKKALVKVIT